MSKADAKERVLGLVPEDYVSGPNPDDKRPSEEVWIFRLMIQKREIYVKICVITDPLLCTCISFHFAEKPFLHLLQATE
jgi:hypothetical protein